MAKQKKQTDDEYAQFLDEISKSIDELDHPYRESRHTRARREARAKRASGAEAAEALEADADASPRSSAGSGGKARAAAGGAKSLFQRVVGGIVRHPVVVVLIVVLVTIALVVGSFFWNRSFRYDDAADFQGTWYIEGTTTAIDITDDSIQLTSDVAYRYSLNTSDKLIDFTFGNATGSGRYWFSDDRTKLVIVDGTDYTGTKTLQEDVERAFESFACKLRGTAYVLPSGDNVTVLDRCPYVVQAEGTDEAASDQAESSGGESGATPAASGSSASSASAASSSSSSSSAGSDTSGSDSAGTSSSSSALAGSFDNPSDTPYGSSSAKSASGLSSTGSTSRG